MRKLLLSLTILSVVFLFAACAKDSTPPEISLDDNIEQAMEKWQVPGLAVIAVKDGETVVLGGFIREKRSTSVTGVPILRSIPLLGNLFKDTATTVAKREVLIFLTPHIMRKES